MMTRTPVPVQDGHPVFIDAASGEVLSEKPEEMTHIRGNQLVPKTDPRIAFRGKLDTLMAEILCVQAEAWEAGEDELTAHLQEVLDQTRSILGAEVKETPLPELRLEGMDAAAIRHASHHIRESAGIDHPIPDCRMGTRALKLNRLRTVIRETELSAMQAFTGPDGRCARSDIVKALNRLSSYMYILFCREAAKQGGAAQQPAGIGAPGIRLVTETEAKAILAGTGGNRHLKLPADAILTPSARDVFLQNRVEIVRE